MWQKKRQHVYDRWTCASTHYNFAFETREEANAKKVLQEKFSALQKGELTWCSVGIFFPYVLYLTPVLNEYIHKLSKEIYECLAEMGGIEISKFYRPFQWLPHTTVGKKLSKDEMRDCI